MDLRKAVIEAPFYSDYLEGKEVEARITEASPGEVSPGERIIAFKNTIASATDVTVPRTQQSHYIGVEGTVLKVLSVPAGKTSGNNVHILIVKV